MSWLDAWRDFIGAAPPVQDTQTRGNGTILLAPRPAQSAAALPRNLPRLMQARGWTVPKLARESGISQSTVRGILNGTLPTSVADPLLSTCLQLAWALGCGIQDLLEEREP